jgi:hypothetical protein
MISMNWGQLPGSETNATADRSSPRSGHRDGVARRPAGSADESHTNPSSPTDARSPLCEIGAHQARFNAASVPLDLPASTGGNVGHLQSWSHGHLMRGAMLALMRSAMSATSSSNPEATSMTSVYASSFVRVNL